MYSFVLRTRLTSPHRTQLRHFPSSTVRRSRGFQLPELKRKTSWRVLCQNGGTSSRPWFNQTNTQIPNLKCQASANNPQSSRRSFLGWILKHLSIWLASTAALFSISNPVFLYLKIEILGLFLAALPTFLSTSLGLGAATMGVNIIMPGIVEVQRLSAGWNRPVHIEGILVKDGIKKAIPVLKIDRLSTSRTLWEIVRGNSKNPVFANLYFRKKFRVVCPWTCDKCIS